MRRVGERLEGKGARRTATKSSVHVPLLPPHDVEITVEALENEEVSPFLVRTLAVGDED